MFFRHFMVLQAARREGGGGKRKKRLNQRERERRKTGDLAARNYLELSAIVKDKRSRINWPISLRGR